MITCSSNLYVELFEKYLNCIANYLVNCWFLLVSCWAQCLVSMHYDTNMADIAYSKQIK